MQRHHPEMPVEQGVERDSGAVSLTIKEALQGTLDEKVKQLVEEKGTTDEEQEVDEEVSQRKKHSETKC